MDTGHGHFLQDRQGKAMRPAFANESPKIPMKNYGLKSLPCPKSLKHPESRRIWKEITREYQLEISSQRILQGALETHQRVRALEVIVEAEGVIIEDRWKQKKVHPAALLVRDLKGAYMKALRSLGLMYE